MKQETTTTILTTLAILGAMFMHTANDPAWTAIWSVTFAVAATALLLHFITRLGKPSGH